MLRAFLDRLYLFAGYLAGAFVVAIFVLMMWLSAGRPLGFNIPAGGDIIFLGMAGAAFFRLAHPFRSRDMIPVRLLVDTVRGPRRRRLQVVAPLLRRRVLR